MYLLRVEQIMYVLFYDALSVLHTFDRPNLGKETSLRP